MANGDRTELTPQEALRYMLWEAKNLKVPFFDSVKPYIEQLVAAQYQRGLSLGGPTQNPVVQKLAGGRVAQKSAQSGVVTPTQGVPTSPATPIPQGEVVSVDASAFEDEEEKEDGF